MGHEAHEIELRATGYALLASGSLAREWMSSGELIRRVSGDDELEDEAMLKDCGIVNERNGCQLIDVSVNVPIRIG